MLVRGMPVCGAVAPVQRGIGDGAACGGTQEGAGPAESRDDSLGAACSIDGTWILCGGLGLSIAFNAAALTTTGHELAFTWSVLLLLLKVTLLFFGPVFGRPTGFLGGEDAGCSLEHVAGTRDFWLGFWEAAAFLLAALVPAAGRCTLATLSNLTLGHTGLSSPGTLQSTGTLPVEGRPLFLGWPSAGPEEAGGGKMEGTASGRSRRILRP